MMLESYIVIGGIGAGVWLASTFHKTEDARMIKVANRFLSFMTAGGLATSIYFFYDEVSKVLYWWWG